MNREERRRAERERRRGGQPAAQLREARLVPGERADAETQDFIAGTIFAAGAASVWPEPRPGQADVPDLQPLFVVLVHDDERTYGPWPKLRDILARVDAQGALASDGIAVATAWTVLLGDRPMVKLKLDVAEPAELASSARLLLLADNYAPFWCDIAEGGMVAVLTTTAYQRVLELGDAASPADIMDRALLAGIAPSPAIRRMIDAYGWPKTSTGR